jgi:hypothetical protein
VSNKHPVIQRRGNWPPGRGYSWPPFQPGHTIGLRHGARSSRFCDPLAKAFAAALLEQRPDLAAYPETLIAWAHAEARVELMRMWFAQQGGIKVNDNGTLHGPWDQLLRFEASAARLRDQLGLTPLSDAQLQRTRAEAAREVVDLESVRERGRQAWAARRGAELEDAADAEVVDG